MKEFNLTEALREWRKERNITSITRETFVKQILEELFELYNLPKESVKKSTEALYNSWFKRYEDRKASEEVLIDGAKDIEVFTNNFVEILGYDNDKCSEEVYKHISCRVQDPDQKLDWENGIGLDVKWKKWADQPESELYEPDYKSCKK